MSRVIDERVLEMSFDNRNFESNVNQSLGTLDKLKNSLNLSSAVSGLEGLGNATSSLTLDPLIASASYAGEKLSAFNVMAITLISDLTRKIENAGISLAKSLSVDQLSAGWSKYGDKVTSVQTIMSATASTWEKSAEAIGFSGTQMEYVSNQLDRLNWFSDETSYSFTDMTSNIGKFTSAGVDLPVAVEAMEGISVWAAKSGQNTQAASRAMYNLAQAISVGSVKLMDWRSIENANMATTEFKQTAIDTAVELGTLKKVSDGVYETLEGSTVTVENFTSAMSEGWFSTDVLLSTLQEYGSAAQRLSEISEDYGVTATSFLKGMEEWSSGNKTIDQVARSLGVDVDELTPLFEEMSKEEYKLGLSAFKAAQETKTFQESIEATKDAVSTGWMKTWELIFGDYEEAKVLWTELTERLWDVFAASGETRNSILSIWKASGGRDDLIQSFWNLWDAISSVTAPIKEAFNIIFRGTADMDEYVENAGKGLANFTKKLREFTEGLIIGDDTADKISRTFQGLFAVVKMVGEVIGYILSKAFGLIGMTKDVRGSLLDLTAQIGDFLVEFSKTSPIDRFAKMFECLLDILVKVKNKIVDTVYDLTGISLDKVFDKIVNSLKTAVDKITEIMASFGLIDLGGVDEFSTNVEKKFNPITFLFNMLKNGFSVLINVFKKMSPVFNVFGTVIGKTFGTIKDALVIAFHAITEAFKNAGLEGVYDLVKKTMNILVGGEFMLLLAKLASAVDMFAEVANGKTGILDRFSRLMSTTKSSVAAWQNELKASMLLKIAAAMAILALALIAIASIDEAKLVGALGVITTEFIDLMIFMKSMSTLKIGGVLKTAKSLIFVAAAVLLLSIACKSLAKMDTADLIKGVIGLGAILAVLAIFANSVKSVKKLSKTATGLILMAFAIRLLIKPIKELGAMKFGELVKGLVAFGAILAMLAGFALLSRFSKRMISLSIGLVIFAAAMRILMKSIKELSEIKFGDLAKALLAFGVILFGIMTFTNFTRKSARMIILATSILVIAAALLVLVKAIKSMGEMDSGELKQGLGAFTLLLTELLLFINLTKKSKKMITFAAGLVIMGAAMMIFAKAIQMLGEMDPAELSQGLKAMGKAFTKIGMGIMMIPKNTIKKGLGLMAIAAGLVVLAVALRIIGDMKFSEIMKALFALTVTMATVAIAANLMILALPGAAALAIIAVSLVILAGALKIFGSMKLSEIGKGLLVMVGAFAVIGVAGLLIGPIVPLLLALAVALTLLGVATITCGAGVLLLATGLATLVATGVAGVAVVKGYAEMLIGLIPTLVSALGEAFQDLIKMVLENTPLIVTTVVTIVTSIAAALDIIVPLLLDLVDKILKVIDEKLPSILESIMGILTTILTTIRDHVGEIVTIVIDILINILNAIAEKLPEFVEAGANLIISLIDGLATSIEKNSKRIRDAIVHLLDAMITLLGELIGLSKDLVEKGKEFINKLIEGITDGIPKLLNKIGEFVHQAIVKAGEKIGEFVTKGREIVSNIISGVTNKLNDLKYEMKHLIDQAIQAIKDKVSDFVNLGKELINGLIDGVKKKATEAVDTVVGLGEDIVKNVKSVFKINSPSKVFRQIGGYLDEGLVVGINQNANRVTRATKEMATDAVHTMSETIANLQSRLDRDLDSRLSFTPVMDLTEIQNGVGTIDSLLNDTQSLRVSSGIDTAYTASIVANDNNDRLIADLTKQFDNLKTEVGSLNESIVGMKIVMDSGTLVGELSTGMDRALGTRAIMAGRRI